MLQRLIINNYVLIEHLEIDWDKNLNIITGETGAGKSILLGALSLLLGAKGDISVIKDTSSNCVIEGTFDIVGLGLEAFFEENEIDYSDVITIRRVISPAGKSRCFIEDCPVQQSILKELSSYLIDIHSQHQNLFLSSESFRIKAMDVVASNESILSEYQQHYQTLQQLKVQLDKLTKESLSMQNEIDWLDHSVSELKKAAVKKGEQQELEVESSILENSDSIRDCFSQLYEVLYNDASGVISSLKDRLNAVNHIVDKFPAAAELSERLNSTIIELKDISECAYDISEKVDSDPERQQKVLSRLDTIYSLSQKYHVLSGDELPDLLASLEEKLSLANGDNSLLEKTRKEAEKEQSEVLRLAKKLSDSRRKYAPQLSQDITSILKRVGLVDALFTIDITDCEPNLNGANHVEFLFASSQKLTPSPIEKVASGGELGRVMLALKATLARMLSLPTIIFDEIDTGISGTVADSVGEVILELSQNMQVVNITHLPQVASKGDCHLFVYKENATTSIKRLSTEERIQEIAKMISGSHITDDALRQARNLLSC